MRMVAGAAAVLLLGGGGAAFMTMGGAAEPETQAEDAGHGSPGAGRGAEGVTFVDVPPMLVNLQSADGGARFIKLHFMLVPGPKGNSEQLKQQLPLVIDAYQPFLRELRPEDLAGSAAVFRIKEELLVRATDTLGPGRVRDVLIQDLLQQ